MYSSLMGLEESSLQVSWGKGDTSGELSVLEASVQHNLLFLGLVRCLHSLCVSFLFTLLFS